MILTLDHGSDQPLYEQIVAGVRRALLDGTLGPGDALPPGRQLAEALDLSLETVQRAYRQLVAEGIAQARVGRGTRIVDDLDIGVFSLDGAIRDLVDRARQQGLSCQQLVDQVAVIWSS